MSQYEKHIFICENARDAKNAVGCCASKGASNVTDALKKLCNEAGLKGKVRVNKSGCLGQCANGIAVVVYPEGTWYKKVTENDVDEIFNSHILNNKVVDRLVLKK